MTATSLGKPSEPRYDESDVTPSNPMLVHLSRALTSAAESGRPDLVAEVAAIVAKLAGEERARANVAAGVPSIEAARTRKTPD